MKVTTQTVFEYLDDLRESGETNMFGACPYLIYRFNLDKDIAGKYLSAWMTTFDSLKEASERAVEAEAKGLV